MKKILLLFSLLFSHVANSQQISTLNLSAALSWEQMKTPVNVSFASSDIRFSQEEVPTISAVKQWNAVAWKGEKIHTQILIWTSQDIAQLKISVSELNNKKGERIPASSISTGFIGYVITDEFAQGCGYRKAADFDSSWVADPITNASAVGLVKNKVQPAWLSITVPPNTSAGQYDGVVTIDADKSYKLNFSVKVLNHVLPPPNEWKFDLDLWQHPAAVARVHNVPLWSKEHYQYMRPYYEMLAKAGQKNITTSIIREPWNHQTYDDFPSLIKWTKRKDGTWHYDYTLFDQYVAFVMSCGINQRINCYTMVPWEMSFQYHDESLGKDTALVAKTGTPEYNAFWSSMLKSFSRHLKEKGWFEKTTIAMDERPMKDMQAVIALLKSVDPNWKIALAGEYHPEIEKDIFDYCVASKWQFDSEVLRKRKADGKPSTYYTCCTEPYPNGFTFSPPAEHVWIGWYAAAKGFTGYLRWTYNSWVKNPLLDSRFTAWPAGDTYQIYPGPLTSIRFEKLIEGIQDFEKIRLLRKKFTQVNDHAKLAEIDKLLSVFEIQALGTTPAADMVNTAKAILNTY